LFNYLLSSRKEKKTKLKPSQFSQVKIWLSAYSRYSTDLQRETDIVEKLGYDMVGLFVGWLVGLGQEEARYIKHNNNLEK